ncbi:hypothetical protein J7F03_01465 [Streptomyces sp. ISL-43]|uniref:hypothetical protein n=1 Tax=Streptomyces sp. ISL-43 TaxID=2819183 RepID=UPI001BE876A5|nr:hypothetical protein [Streptomyces sp. ISL-43]MBT2445776.1 hypothetical protein [Streptomyces sp. ISL-43]
MSFGDPNNPYGQQPQGQPGYGYPQQAPQGIPPQGGYAYPQTPQAYPAGPGYPGAHVPMPGGVKGARVILIILGGLQALVGVLALVGGAMFATALSGSSSSSTSDAGALAGGVIVGVGIAFIVLSLWPILTAVKLGKGRGGVRVSGIIFGSLQTLFAVLSLIGNAVALSDPHAAGAAVFSMLIALVSLGLGLWILIGLANSAAGVYFKRPLY